MDVAVRPMKPDDWEAVRAIYAEGMSTGNATFERESPHWQSWDASHLRECRLIARSSSDIIGWVALSPVSNRCVYAGVAEVSLYVRSSARRHGVGKALLQALIDESESAGIWTLEGGVFPENAASIGLLKSCGFREVGRRERLGQMAGAWRDVLLFERRSNRVGI
jgi:L-amino acid N-acyltransferase YncA